MKRRLFSLILCSMFIFILIGKYIPSSADEFEDEDFFYAEINVEKFGKTKLKVYKGFDFIERSSVECNWRLAINAAVLSNVIYENREEDILYEIGFDKVYVLTKNPGFADPGVTMAYKRLEDENGNGKNIFAVIVKGTDSGEDIKTDLIDSWIGEMFGASKDTVVSKMKDYIYNRLQLPQEKLDKEENYFFFTGHSLGGAVANALSVDDDIMRIVSNDKNNIYTYTFESPHTCINAIGMDVEEMSNAYNYKDVDDAITSLPPYPGSTTYGKDVIFSVNNLSADIFKSLYPNAEEDSLREYKGIVSHHNIIGAIIYILQNGDFSLKSYDRHDYEHQNTHKQSDKYTDRYTVLVMDVSGPQTFKEEPNYMNILGTEYTSDSSIESVKKAAEQFLKGARNSIGKNHIAIVTYSTEAHVVSEFTDDIEELEKKLEEIEYEEQNRSIHAGLECAYNLLNNISDENAIKNLLLCTTGLTDEGEYNYEGRYNKDTIASSWHNLGTEIHLYAYANTAIESANKIKNMGVNIYVIGLFDPIEENMPSTSGLKDVTQFLRLTALDIASSESTFYAVHDQDSLDFYFGIIKEDIIGDEIKKIYYYPDKRESLENDNFDKEGGADNKGGRYEYVNYGPSLFEIPSTQMFRSDIFSTESANYNLALLCGCLSAAAYDPDYIVQAYKDLGCRDEDIYLYKYPDSPYNKTNIKKNVFELPTMFGNIEIPNLSYDSLAFSIASHPMRIDDQETDIIYITLRGTQTTYEAFKDGTMSLYKDFHGYYAWDWVRQFKDDVLVGLANYAAEHSEFGKKPVKIVITGHSLGGAAANLLAAELDIVLNEAKENGSDVNKSNSDEVMIYTDDIYSYTFGALDCISNKVGIDPDYYIDLPVSENFENIINIYNLLDTFSPFSIYSDDLLTAVAQDAMKLKESIVGKFGEFYFFANNMEYYVPKSCAYMTHAMGGYIQAIKYNLLLNQQYNGDKIRILICCPVDVEISLEDEKVCIIQNDKIEYLSSEIGASVNDSRKTIILPADREYKVKINATDNGTMVYAAQKLSPDDNEPVIFSNISLKQGKTMETIIPKKISGDVIELYTVDQNGERLTEISNDGTETLLNTEPEPTPTELVTPTPTVSPEPTLVVTEEPTKAVTETPTPEPTVTLVPTLIVTPTPTQTAEITEEARDTGENNVTAIDEVNGETERKSHDNNKNSSDNDSTMIYVYVFGGLAVLLTLSVILVVVVIKKSKRKEE